MEGGASPGGALPEGAAAPPVDDAFLDAAGPQLWSTQAGQQAQAQQGGAPLDESADQRVVDFIATLSEYQGQCEVGGNYEEAARCTDQLRRLRTQEEARRVQALKARHVSERTAVSTAQVAQFRDFNSAWDRYLSEYDAMAVLYVKQLQARHLKKLRAHQEELHAELVHKPVKFGREVRRGWRTGCAALPLPSALRCAALRCAALRSRTCPPPHLPSLPTRRAPRRCWTGAPRRPTWSSTKSTLRLRASRPWWRSWSGGSVRAWMRSAWWSFRSARRATACCKRRSSARCRSE